MSRDRPLQKLSFDDHVRHFIISESHLHNNRFATKCKKKAEIWQVHQQFRDSSLRTKGLRPPLQTEKLADFFNDKAGFVTLS